MFNHGAMAHGASLTSVVALAEKNQLNVSRRSQFLPSLRISP